jgi:NAD(P)H-flavin reductase
MKSTQTTDQAGNVDPQSSALDPWRVIPVTISDTNDEAPSVRSYVLSMVDSGDAARYHFQPGQFNMLYLPGVGEAAMSVSGDPHERGKVVHTVRAIGNVTGTLAACRVGDSLGLRGPFGSHWPLESCYQKDIIIVAGGIGLAPLRPVVYALQQQRDRFGSVSLLIGTRSPADLLYENEFESWNSADIDIQATVDRADDQWSGNIGVVTLLLGRLVIPNPDSTVLFTCGPEVMMNYSIRTALERGVDPSNIWLSLERNMNCAIGHCGHCQLGPHFICKDGPVLRYDQVSKLMEVDSL